MTQQELELPKGWVETNIGSIAKIVHYGYTATSTEKDTGTKYLRITDIQNDHVDWNDVPFCKIPKEKKPNFLLNENDIVFARTGGTVGKSYLIKDDVPSVVFASYLIRVVLTEHTDPQLIHFFFQSGSYWHQIQKGKTGLKTNVNAQILSKLVFQLAPLNEQKRIVSKIGELFSKIDSTKQSLEHTKLRLVQYRHSLLKSAFEGKLTEQWREENYDSPTENQKTKGLPNEWKLVTTDKIGDIITGNTPSTKETIFYGNDIPFFKPTDLNSGYYVKDSKEKLSKKGIQKARQIPEKSVLVTSIGATIGKTGFNRIAGATNQQINSIIPITNIIIPEYLYFICISPQFQKSILDNSSATTLPIINKSKFSKLKIPLPSLQEQEQIVSQIEQGFSLTENSQNIVNSTLQTLEIMRMSILKQAFEGKLVPQDPNDEPASVLLERIKKQKS